MNQKKLSRAVFRPNQHYLTHIPLLIKKLGPLRAYSTRSMERSIGVFSKRINTKVKGGQHASNLVERIAVLNFVDMTIDIQEQLQMIQTRPYSSESYLNNPDDTFVGQLWEPFRVLDLQDETEVEGVDAVLVLVALKRYYTRVNGHNITDIENTLCTISARFLGQSTVYSSCMYRRIKNESSRGNHYIMFTAIYKT